MALLAFQNKKITYGILSATIIVVPLLAFSGVKFVSYLLDQGTGTNADQISSTADPKNTLSTVPSGSAKDGSGAATTDSKQTGASTSTSTTANKTAGQAASGSGSGGGGGSSGGGGTTTPPAPSPTPTPQPASVSHGSQINTSNTGYLAWVGPSGERCTDANITVYNSLVNASSLGSSKTCAYFKGGITIDAAISLTACKVDGIINSTYSFRRVVLNYSTINPASPSDWSLGPGNFSATRSQIMGSSDGVRFDGSATNVLIENYIRLKAQGPTDHNDGIQMYVPTGGGTILRNNIDARPVGGGGGTNAAIFIADNATGTYEIRDNYLAGGGFTLRLHESGYYRATGNIVEKNSYVYGPFSSSASIPGAFLEFSNNRLSDGTPF